MTDEPTTVTRPARDAHLRFHRSAPLCQAPGVAGKRGAGRFLPWAQSLALLLLTCIAPAAHAQAADPAAAPSCSADATKGALDQILRKKVRNFIDTYAVTKDVDGLLAQSTLEFAAIRTQDRDAATGAVTCAANFTSVIAPIKTSHAFPDGVTKNGALDYKVEKTDDGQIYVTVLQADRPY